MRDDTTDLVGLLGEIELRQQAPEAVKKGADEGKFQVAHLRRRANVLGQHAGQVGTQEIFLELIGIALVLQVFEEQHGNRDVAHRFEAEHDHRTGYRTDVAAAGRPEIGRIDQAQQFVGQREVLEDGVRQFVDALRLAVGDLVDGADRFRQGREIALVAHATEQEIDGRLPAAAGRVQVRLGGEIVIQRLGKLAGRLKTQRGVACRGLEQDGAQSLVDACILGHHDILLGDALHDRIQAVADEGPPAEQHFEQDDPGRKDVGTFADRAVQDVLRCHVGRRPGDLGAALAGALNRGGNAEIHDAWRAVVIEQDVRRFQVAMDDALRVGMGDGIENGPQRGDRLDGWQGAALPEKLGQVLAGHVLEDQIRIAALFTRLVDGHDVRMAHAADRPGLGQQGLILGRIGLGEMQGLDRNLALQLGIEAQIDDALRTAPQLPPNLETTNSFHYSLSSTQTRCGTPSAAPQITAFCP